MCTSVIAKYQHLIYGNEQLLLRQAKSLTVVNHDSGVHDAANDDDTNDKIAHPMEPEPTQQKSAIVYSPFFVEITDRKDKDAVYGYIRQQCQPLLPLHQNSYYNIPMDITYIVLYYYCFNRCQYDGSIEEWTKDELHSRYMPLNPIQHNAARVIFEGISTCYIHSKGVGFGAKIALKKIKRIHKPYVSLPLLRELKILRTLFGHPSIVKLHDVLPSTESNRCHSLDSITLIYEGMAVDLQSIFRTNQYFSSTHVQYIMYHILLGVKYIHDAKLVHRGLRPRNILINADCSIKIASFRNACGVHEKKERQRHHVGQRWYRAPETILLHHGRSQDLYAVDMWAFGCVFGELLQMEQAHCPFVHDRSPLFPGDACFPLSPKRSGKRGYLSPSRHDQLRTIFSVIGPPNECDMEWITDQQARTYVNTLKAGTHDEMWKSDHPLVLNSILSSGDSGSAELLKHLLTFDIRTRLKAKDALKSSYFDIVRDMDLETMSPPKAYTYPQIQEYSNKDTLKKAEFNRLLFEEISNY